MTSIENRVRETEESDVYIDTLKHQFIRFSNLAHEAKNATDFDLFVNTILDSVSDVLDNPAQIELLETVCKSLTTREELKSPSVNAPSESTTI